MAGFGRKRSFRSVDKADIPLDFTGLASIGRRMNRGR